MPLAGQISTRTAPGAWRAPESAGHWLSESMLGMPGASSAGSTPASEQNVAYLLSHTGIRAISVSISTRIGRSQPIQRSDQDNDVTEVVPIADCGHMEWQLPVTHIC
jgi:hypothetical protein